MSSSVVAVGNGFGHLLVERAQPDFSRIALSLQVDPDAVQVRAEGCVSRRPVRTGFTPRPVPLPARRVAERLSTPGPRGVDRTQYLSLEDVLSLIYDLGVGPIRDIELLDSAAHRPQVSVYGNDAYPSIDDKAAALLQSLVRNHALVDGNKRLGRLATVVFYGLNDITLEAPDDDAYDLVIAIASGTTTHQDAAEYLQKWH